MINELNRIEIKWNYVQLNPQNNSINIMVVILWKLSLGLSILANSVNLEWNEENDHIIAVVDIDSVLLEIFAESEHIIVGDEAAQRSEV